MEEKIGIVTIRDGVTPLGKKFWMLQYRCPAAYPGDPNKGKLVRRRLDQDANSLDEVRVIADNLTRQAYEGKGYLKADEPTTPTVAKGLALAIRLAGTTKKVEKERSRFGAAFVRWLGEHHPEVVTWEDIRPSILQEYALELERAGKAFDTVRLSIAPVVLAWRRMHQDYPDCVRPCPRIKLKAKPREEMETLRPVEVAALIDWLKEHEPDLLPIVLLQALAGVRVLEAVALRRQDVDLEAGTISVTDTEHHEVKTGSSRRTVPICREALTALKAAIKAQKVIPPGGEIFTNKRRNVWDKDAIVLRWRRIRPKLFKDTGFDSLKSMQAHRLRSFFVTAASQRGVSDRILKAYVGHAPGDIMGQHYRKIDVEELKTVATVMDGWRELIKSNDKQEDKSLNRRTVTTRETKAKKRA